MEVTSERILAGMTNDILVRPAEPADGDTLLTLIDALADYESLPRPDAGARGRLLDHAFGTTRYFWALIAEREGQPVGYALYFFTYSSFLAQPTLYLEDVFVAPQHRGVGAGKALMQRLFQEAVAKDCGRMEWQVLDWNEPSIQFYQRLGAQHQREWLPYRLLRDQLETLAQEG